MMEVLKVFTNSSTHSSVYLLCEVEGDGDEGRLELAGKIVGSGEEEKCVAGESCLLGESCCHFAS